MALIISNEEVEDVIRIVKSLGGTGLLINDVSKTIENYGKEQKAGFLNMLLCTLDGSLLGNLFSGKGKSVLVRNNLRRSGFAMLPHHLIIFEIQRYYQSETKFNGVYSTINLLKIKDGVYVINLDEYK